MSLLNFRKSNSYLSIFTVTKSTHVSKATAYH